MFNGVDTDIDQLADDLAVGVHGDSCAAAVRRSNHLTDHVIAVGLGHAVLEDRTGADTREVADELHPPSPRTDLLDSRGDQLLRIHRHMHPRKIAFGRGEETSGGEHSRSALNDANGQWQGDGRIPADIADRRHPGPHELAESPLRQGGVTEQRAVLIGPHTQVAVPVNQSGQRVLARELPFVATSGLEFAGLASRQQRSREDPPSHVGESITYPRTLRPDEISALGFVNSAGSSC
jgi:hypothetical protein